MKGGKEANERRKLEENQDIALVDLKRMVEKNKVDKIQSNLHLIDFPKQNQHIFFVADPKEALTAHGKRSDLHTIQLKKRSHSEAQLDLDDANDLESEDDGNLSSEETPDHHLSSKHAGEKEKYVMQLKKNLSANKGQYKKLADAIIKEEQYTKVE